MDVLDNVWILVYYFVEFVEKEGSGWTWKYIGNCRANVTPLLVSNTTTYVELCDKVRKVLGVDSMFNDIEIATVVPGMSNVPISPMKIDCHNSVKWYLSVYREVPLCVTLLTKGVEQYEENDGLRENQEHATIVSHGDSLSEMQTEDGTCRGINRELNYV
ncbi:Uncharacterized protein Adt_14599 [Abeliophyllum distichum]|uniref:Uncharacterized protein n=1 Tax=Abeliophyllum distichum TaxID=126358 RepID=A0ABD1U033_9LAMI